MSTRVAPIEFNIPPWPDLYALKVGTGESTLIVIEIENVGAIPFRSIDLYGRIHNNGSWWVQVASLGEWASFTPEKVIGFQGSNPYELQPGEKTLIQFNCTAFNDLKLEFRSLGDFSVSPKPITKAKVAFFLTTSKSSVTGSSGGGGSTGFDSTAANAWLTTKDTDDLNEGLNHLYYTHSRVLTVTAPYRMSFTDANLSVANLLGVAHNMGEVPTEFVVINNLGRRVMPSDIKDITANSVVFDFTGMRPLIGTYTLSLSRR